MPGSFLTDDIAMVLQTGDFATEATFDSSTINVIFDQAFVEQDAAGSVQVEGYVPMVYCQTSDVSSAAHGDSIVIDSTTYTIVEIENDRTGMTMLRLNA